LAASISTISSTSVWLPALCIAIALHPGLRH
jgi:hypothetical protein